MDCRKPYLPFSEFYNEPLSDVVEMDRDFANYKSESGKFKSTMSKITITKHGLLRCLTVIFNVTKNFSAHPEINKVSKNPQNLKKSEILNEIEIND